MSWIEPIFHRTSDDVLKVQTYDTIGFQYLSNEQKIKWMNSLKGALNFKDLNRIENNMEFLANLYEIENMNFKTNWSYIDIPSRLDFQPKFRRKNATNYSKCRGNFVNGHQYYGTLFKTIA